MNLFFWCGNTNQRTRWQVKKKGTRRYTTFHNSPFFLCKKKKENHIGRALFNSTRLSLSLLLFPFFFFTHLLYMVRTSPRGCVRCRLNVDWISSTATLRTRCLCCWGALLFFFLCSWLFPPPPPHEARDRATKRMSAFQKHLYRLVFALRVPYIHVYEKKQRRCLVPYRRKILLQLYT